MRRFCVLFFASALLAIGQESGINPVVAQVPTVQRIFEVKYADVQLVGRLLSALVPGIHYDTTLRVIAVNGTKEGVAAVEEALKRLDVPPPPRKNIELTVYMIMASPKADGEPESPELAPVFKQLRGIFPYKSYRLLDFLNLRDRDGEGGQTSGVVPIPRTPGDPLRAGYQFSYRSAFVGGTEGTRVVRIDRLDLSIVVQAMNNLNARITTDVDVREGQKVVVGKANLTGGDDALILVVTAKTVD